ncbi:MAG: 5-(carboxyamino)imidazole ribonucleotide synthase, partial [Salinisphaeraceae bacterium]|nr:5-(carboxyamino)imidazole ribonucleotide synthase [Salinisphaeraceae bacterium]
VVLSPVEKAPASDQADEYICADYTDTQALEQLAQKCDVVTLDNEHIPQEALVALTDRVNLQPSLDTMSHIRDRLAQRNLLAQLDLPQTRFWSIDKTASVHAAQQAAEFPAVLKSRHGGYDGYGQRVVRDAEQLPAAWEELKQRPCILEGWVNYQQEFSIVGARGQRSGERGEIRLYDPISNHHEDGQLQRSDSVAGLPAELKKAAEDMWCKIAEAFDYQGTMAVEFFLTEDNQVLINEIAPRVHNSGHVTQMAYELSQFDMHVRGVLGLPLAEIQATQDTVMFNLYPEHGFDSAAAAERLESLADGRVYWYGKSPRPRRKMGHWLVKGEQADIAQRQIMQGSTQTTANNQPKSSTG